MIRTAVAVAAGVVGGVALTVVAIVRGMAEAAKDQHGGVPR